ncbi:MAG TPA: hypothetical protein V6D10_00500 [Trichocoleus sp.]|jgi:hypothetical protein
MNAIDNLIHNSAFAIHDSASAIHGSASVMPHNPFVGQDIASVKQCIAVLMSRKYEVVNGVPALPS